MEAAVIELGGYWMEPDPNRSDRPAHDPFWLMLGIEHIDACENALNALVKAYWDLRMTAAAGSGGDGGV